MADFFALGQKKTYVSHTEADFFNLFAP